MKFAETSDLNANVVKNNNIGWKNISIVDLIPYTGGGGEIRPGGVIAIGNMTSATTKYDFEFKSPAYALDHVYNEAEILLTLDAKSWQKWVAGGRRMQNVRVFNESRKQLLILGNNAWIRNLSYLRNERSTMKVSFNFLTQEATPQAEFDYIAVQRKSVGQAVVGGETFRIVKPNPNRQSFAANSQGAATIAKNDSTQLSATTIGEPAIYNWYNAQGTLIHSGATIKVSPAITEKYKLEVIALSDGYKDYDEVTVNVKQHEIKSISPNPVSNTATLVYRIENAVSAYLQLTTPYGTTSNNYILDLNQNQVILDLSTYPIGNYSVILVVDGVLVDTKSLSKQ